jgi:uncharacterized protein YdcH (DUF465 family)
VSGFGDALQALRTVLMMQEDIRQLKESVKSQSAAFARLAEAHGELRDRVSRLEGVIEGAAMASRQRRIEE